VIFTLGEF